MLNLMEKTKKQSEAKKCIPNKVATRIYFKYFMEVFIVSNDHFQHSSFNFSINSFDFLAMILDGKIFFSLLCGCSEVN